MADLTRSQGQPLPGNALVKWINQGDNVYALLMSVENSTIDAFIQDQTTPPFQYYLMREDKTDITLTSAATTGDTVLSVSAGHGFTAATDEKAVLFENDLYTQADVVSVALNDITIRTPLSFPYTTSATVIRGNIDLGVNGSGTEQTFKYEPRQATTPIDVQRVLFHLVHPGEGDDSKFGDVAALTNGVYAKKTDNIIQNLGTYITNGTFREYGADLEYSDKAGGGEYSTTATFDIKTFYGVVLRFTPSDGSKIEVIVRDDLSALSHFHISLMGQYTLGEV